MASPRKHVVKFVVIIIGSEKKRKTEGRMRRGREESFFILYLLASSGACCSKAERGNYRAFSLTWPASMQMYWNKRKRLHKKRVQLLQDWFGTRIWPPWRHVKTPKRVFSHDVMSISAILCGVPWQWNGRWDIGVANPVLSFVPRKFA